MQLLRRSRWGARSAVALLALLVLGTPAGADAGSSGQALVPAPPGRAVALGTPSAILLDDPHQHVFVLGTSALGVYDRSGAVVRVLPIGGTALARNDDVLFVAGRTSIRRVSLTSLGELTRHAPALSGVRSMAWTGGELWVARTDPATLVSSVVQVAAGGALRGARPTQGPALLGAPASGSTLWVAERSGTASAGPRIRRFTVSDGVATAVASWRAPLGATVADASVSPLGSVVAVDIVDGGPGVVQLGADARPRGPALVGCGDTGRWRLSAQDAEPESLQGRGIAMVGTSSGTPDAQVRLARDDPPWSRPVCEQRTRTAGRSVLIATLSNVDFYVAHVAAEGTWVEAAHFPVVPW